jgi:hypothetical protein
MDNISRKNLKTQSIIFGIEILILDSKKKSGLKYDF